LLELTFGEQGGTVSSSMPLPFAELVGAKGKDKTFK